MPVKTGYPEIFNEFKLPKTGRVFKQWKEWPHFISETIQDLALPVQSKDEKKKNDNGKRSKKQFIMGKNWNWHNLRHKRTSLWAKSGMPMVEIMTRLGHNNMSTTMIYLQLLGFTTGEVKANEPVEELPEDAWDF